MAEDELIKNWEIVGTMLVIIGAFILGFMLGKKQPK